jgi:pSer/pThr/pTyr-binding forkhead associated (FHA) protein
LFPTITLTVVEGPHAGEKFACNDRALITIGRGQECTFPLRGQWPDMLISRRHCQIEVHPDRLEIRDLKSRNGTFVNGQRLGFPVQNHGPATFRRRLGNGDRISMGATLLQVRVQAPKDARHQDNTEGIAEYPDAS